MYLPRPGVVRALERVASLLAPGSSLAFDTWFPGSGHVMERLGLAGVRLLGEPIRCAVPPGEVSDLLEEAGLAAREVVTADVFATRAGLGRAYPGLCLVEAVSIPRNSARQRG
jgi:O-methyltransferase involved in polyketide biosynthesis